MALLGGKRAGEDEYAMKRILILSSCVLSIAAQAEHPAEQMGRLFHTPEQRALLDNARKTTPINVGVEDETASAPNVTLKGIVTRSDGKRTVWMNNHPEHSVMQKGVQERNQTQVQLPGGQVKLKVGQHIDPATGQVIENYRRPPPESAAPKAAPAKAASPHTPNPSAAPKLRDENKDSEQLPAP